jgi:hypothetical protein
MVLNFNNELNKTDGSHWHFRGSRTYDIRNWVFSTLWSYSDLFFHWAGYLNVVMKEDDEDPSLFSATSM